MELKINLTPAQIKSLDDSVETQTQRGDPIVVGVSDEPSQSGFVLGEEKGAYFLNLSPSRANLLREKGFTSGISNTGHKIEVYDSTRTQSPNFP